MPKKPIMQKKFKINWQADVYDACSLDIKSLFDLCGDIKRVGEISMIGEELQKMHDAMAEGEVKTELFNVIQKITAISDFINTIVDDQGKQPPTMKRFIENQYGGLGALDIYKTDVAELKDLMKRNKASFFASEVDPVTNEKVSKKGALPLDLRAVWDSFNHKDDYNSFDKNEELFKQVDDLFNRFGQIQNLMGRIYTCQENFETTGRLEDHLANKEAQLKKLGEIVYYHPDLSFMKVSEESSLLQIRMTESKKSRDAYEEEYKEAVRELEKAKAEKSDIEKGKAAYDQKKAEAENRLQQIKKELEESERDEERMMEIKSMNVAGLKAFETAKNQSVSSSKDIIKGSYGDHISQQKKLQHSYSDEAKKSDEMIRELVAKSKDLKAFMETAALDGQYRMYPTMLAKINDALVKLPKSFGINMESMSILELQAELKAKLDQDERLAPLYEAVSAAVEYCPPAHKSGKLNAAHLEELSKSAMRFSNELPQNGAYQAAVDIVTLEEAQRITAEALSKIKDKKSSEKKELEDRQKKIKKDIKKIKDSKHYIKDSEKLLGLLQKSEDNTIKANDCRFNIVETYALADLNEDQLNRQKDEDVAREKNTIITDLESILKKLPAEPAEIVSEMKKAVADMKKSDDAGDVKNAYRIFAQDLKKMDRAVTKRTDDLNTESQNLQIEAQKWNLEASLKACDKKIGECESEVNEAKRKVDKYQKQYDEYSNKHQKLVNIDNTLDRMYEDKKKIKDFEKEKANGEEAQSELKGKLFFTQLQKTFASFSQRKDHNKNDHQNTTEYTEMDTKLNDLLALDPGSVTAADYRKALTDLRTMALAYIEKKHAQSFRWIPSKLRKYRLQYAKGLADMCASQLDTIDEDDFTKIEAPVAAYLKDVTGRGIEIKEFTQEVFLEQLTDQKQAGLKAYKYAMGIDEVDDEPFKIPQNAQANPEQLNVTQVEELPVENVQFDPGVKNKEVQEQ